MRVAQIWCLQYDSMIQHRPMQKPAPRRRSGATRPWAAGLLTAHANRHGIPGGRRNRRRTQVDGSKLIQRPAERLWDRSRLGRIKLQHLTSCLRPPTPAIFSDAPSSFIVGQGRLALDAYPGLPSASRLLGQAQRCAPPPTPCARERVRPLVAPLSCPSLALRDIVVQRSAAATPSLLFKVDPPTTQSHR